MPSPSLGRSSLRRIAAALLLATVGLSSGCAVVSVAGAAVGAAIEVTGAVVSTGVRVTGKAVEKTIDLVTPSSPEEEAKK
jgi:uncharacterized transporter YbjL